MQQGSVLREHRKLGPDVWYYRWWESGPSGNRTHRRIVLGTAEQLRDIASARQMTSGLVQEINASDIRMTGKFMTLAQLADHFHQREVGRFEHPHRVLCRESLSRLSRKMDCAALGRLPTTEHQGRLGGVVA